MWLLRRGSAGDTDFTSNTCKKKQPSQDDGSIVAIPETPQSPSAAKKGNQDSATEGTDSASAEAVKKVEQPGSTLWPLKLARPKIVTRTVKRPVAVSQGSTHAVIERTGEPANNSDAKGKSLSPHPTEATFGASTSNLATNRDLRVANELPSSPNSQNSIDDLFEEPDEVDVRRLDSDADRTDANHHVDQLHGARDLHVELSAQRRKNSESMTKSDQKASSKTSKNVGNFRRVLLACPSSAPVGVKNGKVFGEGLAGCSFVMRSRTRTWGDVILLLSREIIVP
jgi:hypothetical protein